MREETGQERVERVWKTEHKKKNSQTREEETKVEGGILVSYQRTPSLIFAQDANTMVKQPAAR
jgi:hypothetical protein